MNKKAKPRKQYIFGGAFVGFPNGGFLWGEEAKKFIKNEQKTKVKKSMR